MPIKAPHLCPCGFKIAYGERCACQRRQDAARKHRADTLRLSARRRGYDAEWERKAKAFLSEPGNERCECGKPATLVRHVISIRKRPDLRMARSNWRPGCVRCNAIDTARDRRECTNGRNDPCSR